MTDQYSELQIKCGTKMSPQTGLQIDWNDAPEQAASAEISLEWYDKHGHLILTDILAEFTKPITAHPHAEIIAKYAEVASRRIDPWVEFEITFSEDNEYEDWERCDCEIRFLVDSRRYRHIGDN